MELQSAEKAATRLQEIFISKFMSDIYTKQFSWSKSMVAEENVDPVQIYRDVDVQVSVFIDIASKLMASKQDIDNLVLITDPWVIYGFNHFCKAAIKILEEQGDEIYYKVPADDRMFFIKFATMAMESDVVPSSI